MLVGVYHSNVLFKAIGIIILSFTVCHCRFPASLSAFHQNTTNVYMYAHVDVVLKTSNVFGKRADHASERIKISPTLPSTINYRSKIEDIGKKQLVLQTTELGTMSDFTTSATPW